MSTRATISTEIEGEIKGIYVHFDGYEDGVGKILEDNYLDYDYVVQLIEQGAASYMGNSIEDCDFYYDRGEPLEIYEAEDTEDFITKFGESYNYFFDPETESWEIL